MRAQRLRDLLRPRRLLRVRTSTWVLLAIFLVALAAYTYVKPPPATTPAGGTGTTVQPSNTLEPTSSPTVTPTHTSTATPSRTASKEPTPTSPTSTTATPSATADPSPSAFGSPP